MQINRFQCENFRNIAKAELEPEKAVNIIYGENAQGKTNLIEALWMFTGMRSFRKAKDSELVRIGEQRARASVEYFSQGRIQKAELCIEKKRTLTKAGIPVERPAMMAESFPVIVFSPAHLMLIKGSPSERRRFLDLAIAQIRPRYPGYLQEYTRAMDQRNALIRDVRQHSELLEMLDLFEQRMAAAAEKILNYRIRYCQALGETMPGVYDGLSQGKESLAIRYSFQQEEESLSGQLLRLLRESRENDLRTGITSVGPHRDDLEIAISGLPAKQYGSQGQQRSAVLALKIAEAALLRRYSGEQPVALLDDVMSELDAGRQDYILNHTQGWQVFVTCCEPETVRRMGAGKAFKMDGGTLTPG